MAIFKPSNFEKDPYGYVTNQISHALYVGLIILALGACAAHFWWFGTYPYRWQVWAWGTTVYIAYEIIDQGWQGWDTFEDTACVSLGLGGPLYTFKQVSEGSSVIAGDIMDAVPFAVALSVVLGTGAAVRWYQSLSKV